MPVPPPSARATSRGHARTAWLFARMAGVVSLTAFASLHAQVHGLFGEQGILPLGPRLERVRDALWISRPSLLFETGASDGALTLLCVGGELASLLLALGVLPGPSAIVAALAYVSLVNVGTPFFPLQWDTLLIETLWLTALISPWRVALASPLRATEPPVIVRWALCLLVARLMLASGIVKWIGDEVWRDLSALSYHFETQPLPGPLAPFLHAAPPGLLSLGVLLTLAVEIPLPFLVLLGARGRRIAVAGFVFLQIAIALTGNFGFFNLLTVVLCIALLDDSLVDRVLPARWRAPGAVPVRPLRVALPSALASLLIVLQIVQLGTSLGAPARGELRQMLAYTQPLWLTSSYGLFADMTTQRPELVLEGSADGETWVAYDFRYKPGDALDEPLPITGPHMPRLDWMLWFAALGGPEDAPWVRSLQVALVEGRAPVLALFERDPFEGAAPRFVRVVAYDYELEPPGAPATWSRRGRRPWGGVLTGR